MAGTGDCDVALGVAHGLGESITIVSGDWAGIAEVAGMLGTIQVTVLVWPVTAAWHVLM